MRTHLTGRDTHGFVAEHVASEDIRDTQDDDDDAAGDDDLPGGGTEGLLGGGFFVEVAEDRDAKDDHEDSESDKAGGRGEERPGAGDVGAEDWELGKDEGHWEMLACCTFLK